MNPLQERQDIVEKIFLLSLPTRALGTESQPAATRLELVMVVVVVLRLH